MTLFTGLGTEEPHSCGFSEESVSFPPENKISAARQSVVVVVWFSSSWCRCALVPSSLPWTPTDAAPYHRRRWLLLLSLYAHVVTLVVMNVETCEEGTLHSNTPQKQAVSSWGTQSWGCAGTECYQHPVLCPISPLYNTDILQQSPEFREL